MIHGRGASKGWGESKLGEQDLDWWGWGIGLDVQGSSADLGFGVWPSVFCDLGKHLSS